MPVVVQDARQFRSDRAWGARELAEIDGATVRLHWTDAPYVWHVNDGTEVFAVIDGIIDMDYRDADSERRVTLSAGDIFIALPGDAHVARPRGEARIFVIERKGSI